MLRARPLLTLNLPGYLALPTPCSALHPCKRFFATLPFDDKPSFTYEPPSLKPTYIVRKKGMELLNDPWYNKGTAFPNAERERLGLRGLIPPRVLDMSIQLKRFMEDYSSPRALVPPEDEKLGGVTSEMARRWKLLQELHDRNETLFFKVLVDNFEEMAPIVYTPTVGWVCVNYHHLYRRPRGMFFSFEDRGNMAAMVWNWPQNDVAAIVVTDGSRILGLGDLGVNGLGIPVGKLDLYCAAAGFSPASVLPVVLDVGTNNEKLLKDSQYLGHHRTRITGQAYYDILDEFVNAVMARWPKAVLQFEDFSLNHALTLLDRYRHHHLVFNDDIQGMTPSDLANQRIICVGAGSAGMGVTRMISAGMQKQSGLSPENAARNFWVLDHEGLITEARADRLADHVKLFARPDSALEGMGLIDVIKMVRPTILLGLSGAGRIFSDEVLQAMDDNCKAMRPIIFPMSNPTSKLECTAEDVMRVTKGRAIFASGSPQAPVKVNGEMRKMSQANNMYIFPGIALGAYLGATRTISDGMLMRAAETLPRLISSENLKQGLVYPGLAQIRDVSASMAMEVIKAAQEEGRLYNAKAAQKLAKGDEHLRVWIKNNMFVPQYSSLVQLPVGVEE